MSASSLAHMFSRMQTSPAECAILNAILSVCNIFGERGKLAFAAMAAISGYSERHCQRCVYRLEAKHLLRVQRGWRWTLGKSTINVYTVVCPWRREISYPDVLRKKQARQQAPPKYDMRRRAHSLHTDLPPTPQVPAVLRPPCDLCTEAEATRWYVPGSAPWYHAQGLPPPGGQA